MIDLLTDAYGISQLECDNTFCAWLDADGQPAAGTMVERGSRAGLLDSKQTPLPVLGGGKE